MQKRNRVGFQFFVTRFFRKRELDITNIGTGSFFENEKEDGFL